MSYPHLTTMPNPSYTNHISRSSAGELQWLYCCNNDIMTNCQEQTKDNLQAVSQIVYENL